MSSGMYSFPMFFRTVTLHRQYAMPHVSLHAGKIIDIISDYILPYRNVTTAWKQREYPFVCRVVLRVTLCESFTKQWECFFY